MDNIYEVKIVPKRKFRISKLGKIVLLLYCFHPILIFAQANKNYDLRVMTFNIRYGTANDGENSWTFRKNIVVETIKTFKPDLLGLQEALDFQIDELLKQMPEYSFSGVGRDDGKSKGEFSCILYLKNRFEVDSTETFWFSETPKIAGSKSWGNNITRICTWILLNDNQTNKKFYMFNVHLDHESQSSREKSAMLLVEKINQKKLPIILTGDFNCGEENKAIKTVLSNGLFDSYRKLHSKQSDEGTFNSFKGDTNGEKIDFIFTSKEFNIKKSEIIRTNYSGKFPSDHFPVSVVISF